MDKNEEGRQKLKEIRAADPDFNKQKAADEIGVHIRTINKWLQEDLHQSTPKINIKDRRKRKKDRRRRKSGGGIDAFRMRYDNSVKIPTIIEDGIEKYLTNTKGEPDWMRDKDFREACGVPVTKWRRYAEDYKDYQVVANGEIIWGHPDIIDEMRKAVNR